MREGGDGGDEVEDEEEEGEGCDHVWARVRA